ncbi:universal stress protein [Paraburkholderia bryophila]|uniref:Nucleotide-binding universal stress UspA family protein n=1 Tax=Paraburkholderia bryophila TaxID=420952 RepID=A0A7Y9W589_9BURK|nr:universal stress protein [Paraburkholderia bryophila]NYH14192.1 nucleotide-binding universal stress UspA family protein [Paraburkholderia bryophila]
MSCRTLLVHLDDSTHSTARTEFALELARRYDAHLIGLYLVCQDLTRPIFLHGEGAWMGAHEAQRDNNLKDAQTRFLAAAERAGLGAEWRAPAGPVVETAVLHARHADLLILGQYDERDNAAYVAHQFVADVVMSSGRPAIVLPYAGKVRSFAQSVLIAWDGSRESARAMADALPVIRQAKFVTVVTVETGPASGTLAGIDVAAWLERHDIQAGFATAPKVAGVPTGAMLLNMAADRHIDLLVMGAYGHARAHERLLGGVTRTLLESMTVPVLMSH